MLKAIGAEAQSCNIGIESTVVSLVGNAPLLLRAGAIPAAIIEEKLQQKLLRKKIYAQTPTGTKNINSLKEEASTMLESPGMFERHYAPSRPLRINARARASKQEAFIEFGAVGNGDLSLSKKGCLHEAAHRLYYALHELDRAPFRSIAIAPIPKHGLGEAINDRLRRASSNNES